MHSLSMLRRIARGTRIMPTSFPFLAKGVGRGGLGDLTSPPEGLRTASQLRDSAGLAPASPTRPRQHSAPGHSHRLNALWLSPRGPSGRRGTSVALVRKTRPAWPFSRALPAGELLMASTSCWHDCFPHAGMVALRELSERYNRMLGSHVNI